MKSHDVAKKLLVYPTWQMVFIFGVLTPMAVIAGIWVIFLEFFK